MPRADCDLASSNIYKSPKTDVNGIDWMAQQNGGNFDPVLFGDYRDPQDNILNNTFSGSFFNDAFLMQDFSSPFNATDVVSPPKRDLMKETEIQQNGENEKILSVDKSKLLINCGKLRSVTTLNIPSKSFLTSLLACRDRVKNSAKVQSGEIDIDNLCAQLKAKAKCTGEGPSIEQKDVDDILGPEPVEHKDPRNMFI